MAALGMFLVVLFFSSIVHYVMKEDFISPWSRQAASLILLHKMVHRGVSTPLCVSHIMAPTGCEVFLSRWMEH